MSAKNWVIGLTCGFVLALASGGANAKDISWKGSFSGSGRNTEIDTNGDGRTASFLSGGAKSTLGAFTTQGMNELAFSGPTICPNGNPGVELTLLHPSLPAAPAHYVTRFEKTGALLFSAQTAFTLCVDPSTGMQFYSGTTKITGGTGRFEGATGTVEFRGTSRTLFSDAAGNFLSATNFTFKGAISTP